MHLTVIRVLEAPRAAVFAVLSDPRRRIEWQSSLLELHVETEGPPRLGTRWREKTKGSLEFEMEITVFEPPLRWGERGRGRLGQAELLVRFDEVPGASEPAGTQRAESTRTSVRLDVDVHFKGPLELLSPLVRWLMPLALKADLNRAEKLALRGAEMRDPIAQV